MAYTFGSLVFTPVIKELQERYGSRRQYAKREASAFSQDGIGPSEIQFLAERDSFYMASVGATGWPYIQHRGGPKGFLKVIDEHTVAFADFRGNKQFISNRSPVVQAIVIDRIDPSTQRTRESASTHARGLDGTYFRDRPAADGPATSTGCAFPGNVTAQSTLFARR